MVRGVALAFFIACALNANAFAPPTSRRHPATMTSAKKGGAGGFGASTPKAGFGASTPKAAATKKSPKDEDGPSLARPWDVDASDDSDQTRQQKRGGKGKVGKRGDGGGPAPNPSGGMAAGIKLK
mmetsp:Transcript_23654/g.73918  ORF Transcript_23654/g.73918 Transcript_23654/m.73918 type:complete len:125 (+) Transcript_23654:180-554(+)